MRWAHVANQTHFRLLQIQWLPVGKREVNASKVFFWPFEFDSEFALVGFVNIHDPRPLRALL
jgi:hypothetical protein